MSTLAIKIREQEQSGKFLGWFMMQSGNHLLFPYFKDSLVFFVLIMPNICLGSYDHQSAFQCMILCDSYYISVLLSYFTDEETEVLKVAN